MAVIHTFDGTLPGEIRIPLPPQVTGQIRDSYCDSDEIQIRIEQGTLCYRPTENKRAAAVYIA